MISDRKSLIKLLRCAWPDAYLKISDKKYHLLNEGDLNWLLLANEFHKCEGIKEIQDCDDFSLIFHAFIRQEQYRQKWDFPWALGEASYDTHAVNFCIDEQTKIYLFDVQRNTFWIPKTEKVYFARM